MHCIEQQTTRTRQLRALAIAGLSAGALLLMPAANAQVNPPQARPQAQPPQTQSPQAPSPSPTISDEKLSAAAVAVGHVTTIRQDYERKISEAPTSDKQRLTEEANGALEKAVTDQGLTVDEYNSIIRTAQNDAALRQKLSQRIPRSGQ